MSGPCWQTRLEVDPVAPDGAMIGVPDAFEDSAAALGGAGRRNVVREARDEHTVDLQRSARLHEHFAERPGGQTAAARRRTDAVADVAQVVVELVTQRDASHDLSVFEDPSRRAVAHVRTRSPSGVGESEAVLHPVRETLSGVQVVFFGHAEAVLVKPGPPVVPTLQEGGVEPRAGRNQFLHEIEPTRGWRTGAGPSQAAHAPTGRRRARLHVRSCLSPRGRADERSSPIARPVAIALALSGGA